MTDQERRFGRLYAELAGSPRETSQAAQRARLVMRLRSGELGRPARGRPRWPLALGLAGAAALALVLWVSAWKSNPDGELLARWQGSDVGSHAALVAGDAAPAPIDFSDGSRITLEPSAVAKLETVSEERTGLVLEQGRVSAKIKQHVGRAWTISAGPYRVEVTGTEFTVDWDRASGFRVAVHSGSVRVTGGDLPNGGVALGEGQQLSRATRAKDVSPETPPTPAPPQGVKVTDLPVVDPEEGEGELPRALPREPTDDADAMDPPETPQWRSLAEDGDYVAALRLAEASGFDDVVATSGPSDLLLLGNAARYARNGLRAKQAYTAIRGRFPGTHTARLSAYYLARLAGDVERQPRSEATWLRTYLTESPSGELSGSARARLMELLRSLGDAGGARSVAADYLKHHPNGPHADVARSLLGQRSLGQRSLGQ